MRRVDSGRRRSRNGNYRKGDHFDSSHRRSKEKRLRCAPANCPYKPVIGELENRQTARFLRPLALGAWTYVAGSPTAKA